MKTVKKLVATEVESSHGLLNSRPLKAIDYKPVVLMLLTARWGNFKNSNLRAVATSLALLNLGAKEHYLEQNHNFSNLSLVAGDYWYARAMVLASSLGDVRVNELLASIIGNLAEAEEELRVTENKEVDSCLSLLEKKGSFYKNAFPLGVLAGGLEEDEMGKILVRLGKEVALISQLKSLKGEEKGKVLDFCRSKVGGFLGKLKEHRCKGDLRQVIEEIGG